MTPTKAIGGQTSPEQRHRIECAQRLTDLMEGRFNRKQLILKVRDDYGVEISEQSLSNWLNGKWLPNPLCQAAIAGVFGIPPHIIWPAIKLERVA